MTIATITKMKPWPRPGIPEQTPAGGEAAAGRESSPNRASANRRVEPMQSTERILFLIDNLRPGGAQKALLAICRALPEHGVTPAVWRLGGTSEIEKDFERAGAPVLGGCRCGLRGLAQPLALMRYIRREKVALMQTLLFHSDVTGRIVGRLARRHGRPVIVSSARATNLRNRWWQFALQRATAPLSDAFTAVSVRTLDFAARREGLRRDRATVIPNGIDVSEWETPGDGTAFRAELGIAEDAFVVGTLGRLHEQKGHAHLLEAAAIVARRLPDAVFLIAGYGPLREKLEAQSRALGVASRARFLGYRSDAARVLAALDVFVLPSLWEGMSNAVLEAMAAGKPVIATAVDGNVEQVSDGDTGLLVPPADAGALANAILRLADDHVLAASMGRRGRERVAREFSLERMIAAHVELYERLLRRSR